MDAAPDLTSLALVFCAAALATIVSRIGTKLVLPTVVVEIFLGILIGPQVLDLAEADQYIEFLSGFGLVFLFFLAGIEVIHSGVPRRLLARGSLGWGISIALGAAAGFALEAAGVPASGWLIAVALATTALGTLMPILSDAGLLRSPLGQHTLGSAVAGEFWPIVVISLFLTGAHATTANIVFLLGFGLVVAAVALLAVHFQPPRILSIVRETIDKSGQLAVRLSVATLALLVLLANELNFDFVLGAFAAGLIIGLVTHGETGERVLPRISSIGYGLLIPVFFVVTGMDFDLDGLLTGIGITFAVVFLGLFLVTRGSAALLSLRELGARGTAALALFSATGLPLIVAVIEVGERRGEIDSHVAAALVGAGMTSVLLYPLLGLMLTRGDRAEPSHAGRAGPASGIEGPARSYGGATRSRR
jgi:Kef-type K+ transport system membrane component KefB